MQWMFLLWYLLLLLTILVAWPAIQRQPITWVQKLGWILVILYTGPIGFFAFVFACYSPKKEWHSEVIAPTWKQAVNSEVHCVAGDATAIIVAAFILSFIELPLWIEILIEYFAAFIAGWFIFQAGMMKNMYSSYGEAVRKTFFSEGVSMNFVMVGMLPVMVTLMHLLPNGRNPAYPDFWFSMAMATIAGAIVGYPINYWLVNRGLKHGCMTVSEETSEDRHMHHHHHEMKGMPFGVQVLIFVLTYIPLFLVMWGVSFAAPLS